MKKKYYVLLLMIISLCFGQQISAQGLKDAFKSDGPLEQVAGDGGAGYDTAVGTDGLETKIGDYINVLLSLLGIIFLGLAIYAGYEWMTSQGDNTKITTAKNILTSAIIGLIIIVGAYAITSFVISRVTKDNLNSAAFK